MDASTVIAICGVVIAVASLIVSAYVAWATRKHNRLSVRPLLGLRTAFPRGATAGSYLSAGHANRDGRTGRGVGDQRAVGNLRLGTVPLHLANTAP